MKLKDPQCVCCSTQEAREYFREKKVLSLKTARRERLFINTFSEKSSFLKEFNIVKIKN